MGMSLFEQACRAYFAAKHPDKEVTSVTFEYAEGFHYSSVTYEDSGFKVTVWGPGGYYIEQYENTTAGEFLTELFSWEASSGTPDAG